MVTGEGVQHPLAGDFHVRDAACVTPTGTGAAGRPSEGDAAVLKREK